MFCIKCGKPVSDSQAFCGACGAPVKRETETAVGVNSVDFNSVSEPENQPQRKTFENYSSRPENNVQNFDVFSSSSIFDKASDESVKAPQPPKKAVTYNPQPPIKRPMPQPQPAPSPQPQPDVVKYNGVPSNEFTPAKKEDKKSKKKETGKNVMLVLLSIVLIFSIVGNCLMLWNEYGSKITVDSTDRERINDAIEIFSEELEKYYDEFEIENRYIEIKNVRIIWLKDNDNELLKDVECIVEFLAFTNYEESEPYYTDVSTFDTIVFRKDGSYVVEDYMSKVHSQTYSWEHTEYIDRITDYDDEFNQVIELSE